MRSENYVMKKKFKLKLSTTQLILSSFLLAILIGSLLLTLPISSATGERVGYIDSLFTATTATCVTGLVTLPTAHTWSIFGQIIILILIQIGGLGIINVMAYLMIALNRRMGLRDTYLVGDAFNLNSHSGISKFLKKVVIGTFTVEGVGALLYMIAFIPEFGTRGIWISVFTSISAFCNAGIDVIGTNSLCSYATNTFINAVTSALIITGGIGYIVWWDVIRVFRQRKKLGKRIFSHLSLHSKMAISMTVALLFGGAIGILLLEYNNPETLGAYSLFDKIQVSLFQSITTRTAGFASIPQENLGGASVMLCLILMFIGGSPVGTAGGVKTVTILVLLSTMRSVVKNKNEVSIFGRNLSHEAIKKAVAVSVMSLTIMLISTILLLCTTSAPLIDVLYETVSATATVGLTRNLTPSLNVYGKLIIIATMYLGRIGPISIAIAFASSKAITNNIKNPTEEISVG